MDELHTREVDDAIEGGYGTIIGSDTVAILDRTEMYSVYKKVNESRWELIMTSFTLENIMENK